MATVAQPKPVEQELTAAEQALLDAFDDIVEPMTSEQRAHFYAELRTDAIARGE